MLTTPLFLILIAIVGVVLFFGFARNRHKSKNAGVADEGRTIHHSSNPGASAKADTDFPAMPKPDAGSSHSNRPTDGQRMRD